MRRSRADRGLNLIELLVVLAILALIVGILLPMLGAARRSARGMQSNTQTRGIHQSMVMWARDHSGYFPGVSETGELLPADAITGSDHGGEAPGSRMVLLMNANYFTGEYAISPVDSAKTEWTTTATPISADHYSFAMLALDLDADGVVDGSDSITAEVPPSLLQKATPPATGYDRVSEWSETLNQQALVLTDRNTGVDASDHLSSIHTDANSGKWHGQVVYNDNHVVYEKTPVLTTRFGDAPQNDKDHLFVADTESARSDAAMVYQDGQTLVKQR